MIECYIFQNWKTNYEKKEIKYQSMPKEVIKISKYKYYT